MTAPKSQRGRPKLDRPHRGTVTARFLPDEVEVLKEAASREHRALAAWLRAVAMESLDLRIHRDDEPLGATSPRVGFTMTAEEREAAEAAAARCGLKLGPWLRAAALRAAARG